MHWGGLRRTPTGLVFALLLQAACIPGATCMATFCHTLRDCHLPCVQEVINTNLSGVFFATQANSACNSSAVCAAHCAALFSWYAALPSPHQILVLPAFAAGCHQDHGQEEEGKHRAVLGAVGLWGNFEH